MFKMRLLKVFIGIVIATPIAFMLLLAIALVWPSRPQPLADGFDKSCSHPLPLTYEIKSRRHRYLLAVHGTWYFESTSITVSRKDAVATVRDLRNNPSYIEDERGNFEHLIPAKILTDCHVDEKSGLVEFSYYLW